MGSHGTPYSSFKNKTLHFPGHHFPVLFTHHLFTKELNEGIDAPLPRDRWQVEQVHAALIRTGGKTTIV